MGRERVTYEQWLKEFEAAKPMMLGYDGRHLAGSFVESACLLDEPTDALEAVFGVNRVAVYSHSDNDKVYKFLDDRGEAL